MSGPTTRDIAPTVRSRGRLRTGMSLRTRLVVLGAVAILPLAAMAAIGLYALGQQQTRQAERVGVELSRAVANAVDAELRSAIAILETLATSRTIDASDLPGFRERAEVIRQVRPEWASIALTAPDGRPLVDTGTFTHDGSDLDRESFERVRDTNAPAVGDVVRHPQAGWLFVIRVPVVRNGSLRFVLSAFVSPDSIREVLVRQQPSPDWVVSVVDRVGRRVARSRAHEENLGGHLSPTVQEIVDSQGAEGFGIAYALEGERIFTPYTRLANGWAAVLGFPTALADAAVYRAVSTYAAGLLLSVLLSGLGTLWVVRTIARPIDDLRRAAQAMGRGEPLAAPPTGIPEIREVAAALNAASEELARNEALREDLLRHEHRAREAAESADRAKDQFMAVLSHELRTPLNAVYGWARMLQTGQLRSEPAIERAKHAIVRNADMLRQLIDDLLDLSRIASGKMRLEVRRVDLPQVLQAAVDAVRPAADEKQIHVRTWFDPQAGSIDADPGRIQQIVWNLLMNAVKFTPSNGRVEMRLERVDSHARITVLDTGQGIAPDVLPHVFERFRQADGSSTRPHGGLGLGLALVKHLVELHGGTVSAHSPGTGQGAIFTVTLPSAVAAYEEPALRFLPAARDGSREEVRLDGIRALVVDDDREGLALAEAILSRAGAEVRACTSAATAFDLVCRWQPDVVISDIEMPEEDGYSLIRRVRTLGATEGGATPAIALTAYGRGEDRTRSLGAGFNIHVPKPVDPGSLTALVASITGGSLPSRV